MEMLSPHFSLNEVKCGCIRHKRDEPYCNVSPRLLMLAEKIRERFDCPMITHSVCRCKESNEEAGGVKNSQHLEGKAMDFHVKGFEAMPDWVYKTILEEYRNGKLPELGGLFLYDWGVHIDVRNNSDGRLRTGDYRKEKWNV